MAQYQSAEKVDAIQFTGGHESAGAVLNWANDHDIVTEWTVSNSGSEKIVFLNGDWRGGLIQSLTDWAVWKSKDCLMIYTDEKFKEDYVKVD